MTFAQKTAVALACLSLLALPVLAAAPRAVVDKPIVDVGKVQKGEPIRHEFVIRNSGDAPLEISEVKPSCGCTVADYDKVVAPGQSGKVEIVVKTDAFGGGIAKSVTVFTNDTGNPRLNLVVKAIVHEPVVARPGYARFMTVRGQPVEPSVQTVSATDGSEIEILSVSSPYSYVRAKHGREEGEAWKVELSLDRDAPVGPLADYVVVRTNHPEQPRVKIAVSGLVRPLISVAPKVADFGRRELAEPQSKSLEVKNLGPAAVELTEATSDVEGLEAIIEPVEEGKHYRIQLTLTDALPKGAFEGLLTIKTSSAQQPVVEVPLRGTIL